MRLARLKRVDPREVWNSEAREFTPWLRDNISILSEAVRLDLEVIESEGAVGDFKVDIVAKDLGSGRTVVIENILGPTNHDHLGKLLTYAAGRNARAAILIATDFRDEHAKTLEWLNEISNGDPLFFGVKVEVLRIEDSPPAPDFQVVVEPNEWNPDVIPDLSPKQRAYQEFFTSLVQKVREKRPGFTSATKGLPQNWFSFPAGRTGFSYSVSFARQSRMRVELYIDMGDADKNKSAFDRLRSEQEQIENETGPGLNLEWERLPERRACRIAAYFEPVAIDSPPEDLQNAMEWAIETLMQFDSVFRPRIAALSLDVVANSER